MQRQNLTEIEKEYIRANILQHLRPDIEKITRFENTNRAQYMLESSLNRIQFDRANYRCKIQFFLDEQKHVLTVRTIVNHKDCAEEYKDDVRFNLK